MLKNSNNKQHNSNKVSFRHALPKILSVLAAVILWFYVADIKTTYEEKVITGIPIKIENFTTGGNLDIVSGKDHTIEVTVSGIKSDLDKISKESITAAVDMNGVEKAGPYNLNVYVTSPSGITVKSVSPSKVSVLVDSIKTKHIAVDLNFSYKDISDDISNIGEPIFSTSSIQVTGPEIEIDKIAKLLVNLDFDTINGSINSKGQSFVPVDKDGAVVSSPYITMGQYVVDITIPVYKKKTVEVVPVFDNDLNYNYSFKDLYPKVISIEGEAAFIDSIDCIYTEPVALNKELQNLDLPDGISAFDENGNRIFNVTMHEITATPIIMTEDTELTDA